MKKIVIILIFTAALIYYGVGNFVAPVLNDSIGNTSGVALRSAVQDSSTNEMSVVDKTIPNEFSQEYPDAHSVGAKAKPLDPAIHDAVSEQVNTSHEGLVEEKTDNGVMVNLKGRFRTAPVATINEKGELTVRDYTAPPPTQ